MLWILLLIPCALCLAGRGSPSVALNVTSLRTSIAHPLTVEPFTVWCAPDNPQVTIRRAELVRKGGQKTNLPAKLSGNKRNATFTFEAPTVNDAGEYSCNLVTSDRPVSFTINVYARPVLIVNKEHFNVDRTNQFRLLAPFTHVEVGESANLTCPVLAHPTPAFKWTKDGKPLEMSENLELDGSSIRINSVDFTHAGVYSCEVINEFPEEGKTTRPLLVVNRQVSVKSEVAWIWPLLVILIILILLVLIIAFCEIRKKQQKKGSRYVAQE